MGVILVGLLMAADPPGPDGGDRRALAQFVGRDGWIAEDKLRHFGVSYGLVTFGYAGGRAAGLGDDRALAAAVGGAALAGLAKEIHEARRGGRFSVRDLVADAAGIAAAVLVMRASR